MSDLKFINQKLITEMFKDLKIPKPQLLSPQGEHKEKTCLTSPTSLTSSASWASSKQRNAEKVPKKKHTFELNEVIFEDFALFVKAIGKTLNDYFDEIIFAVVEDNSEFIQQLKRRGK
ncbi:MAG: hypothetical protein LBT30_01460 [Clostridiales bacterium]|jgi:hypothetical protein|nr:hypothetical protein [Clostridiales bacterium]